jgi:tetratricopeptide (TPR) repeat protein
MSLRNRSNPALTPEAANRSAALCAGFEADWQAGKRPVLEEFLAQVEQADRPPLLRELLALELSHRAQLGERPELAEYRLRLVDQPALVEEVFYQLSTGPEAPPEPGLPSTPAEGRPGTLDTGPWTAGPMPRAPVEDTIPPRAGRYEIEGKLGHGGMGEVWRTRHPELQFPLAVKVLGADYRGQPALERRFREEAQITGQLQHPGIPAVHEAGVLPDGRPFFAMKLVKGHTLADLLKERSSAADELPRFLGIFEQVCQTLTYAHSRGVLHRDLKPSNVMIGAFGEVQVMDWGLAKVLRRDKGPTAPDAEGSAIATSRRGAAALASQVGDVLGTPAYMAPEQARGEIDGLDERCDVFGLGGILCAILTGQPPFLGATDQARRRAAAGDLANAFARVEKSGADVELTQLARHCLAADRSGRPADAGEVAAAVRAYLNGVQERLRAAEVGRAAASARAEEERRRRRVQLYLAAAVVLFLAGGGIAAVWYRGQQVRRTERQVYVRQEVDAALREAAGKRQALRAILGHPLKVHALLSDLHGWQTTLDAIEALRRRAWALAESDRELLAAEQLAQLKDLGGQLQADRHDFGVIDQLDKIRQEASVLVKGEVRPATAAPRYERVFEKAGLYVRRDEVAAVAARIRQAPLRYVWVAALDHWASTFLLTKPSPTEQRMVERLLAVARHADRDPWRDQVRGPLAATATFQKLARAVNVARQGPQTLQLLAQKLPRTEGATLLRRALGAYPRDFWLHFQLGLMAEGPAERAGCNQAALAIRPSSAVAHNNWGVALDDQEEYEEAIGHYQKALELDGTFAWAQLNWGNALQAQKDYRGAIGHYQKALRLDSKCAGAHNNWGNALAKEKDYEGAIWHYQQALRLNPKIATPHYNWGNALAHQKDYRGAIGHYQQALRLDPKLADAHNGWGKALAKQKDYGAAIGHYQQALRLDPKLADAHLNWGNVLQGQKDYRGAIGHYQKALEFEPKLTTAHHNWGGALYAQKDYEGAIGQYQKALQLDPSYALAHFNWGNLLAEQKDYGGAIRHYEKALRLDPKLAAAHNNWGNVLADQKDNRGAIGHYQQALRLDPNYAEAHTNLGTALAAQKHYGKALGHFQKALELDPSIAFANCSVGLLLLKQGRFAEGLKYLETGHQLGSNSPNWPWPSAQWLQHCRQLLLQERHIAALLQGKARLSGAGEALRLAQSCHLFKHYPAAARLYALALAARPGLPEKLARGQRERAANAAALAAAGQGRDADKLADEDRTRLRQQALDWLRADLGPLPEDATVNPPALLQAIDCLTDWQRDPELDGVRAEEPLARLPAPQQQDWRKLWAEVRRLHERARACFTETRWEGELTAQKKEQVRALELRQGKTYAFDLRSEQFNPYLRLTDAEGKTLAENDDREPGVSLDSRIVWTALRDGTYVIIATSRGQQGTGRYTLLLREFIGSPK